MEIETEDNIDNKYIRPKKLGDGTYGKVYLAKSKDTNKEVAVKILVNESKMFSVRINYIHFRVW